MPCCDVQVLLRFNEGRRVGRDDAEAALLGNHSFQRFKCFAAQHGDAVGDAVQLGRLCSKASAGSERSTASTSVAPATAACTPKPPV